MVYHASSTRYDNMVYNRCGRSGIKLPALSLGMWHNFGGVDQESTGRDIVRYCFDNGITHLDLANNYGPPPGSAESFLGRMLRDDLKPYRDELIISTKAGFDHWPGPYGDGGSRKYLLASLDQSLKRLGLDYVDIFYSHRPDYDTPFEETMKALVHAHKSGKCLYVGISNYRSQFADEAINILESEGVPCLIHQPPYSMFNRWVLEEDPDFAEGFLPMVDRHGTGVITFSPLSQGLLTNKYLNGIPQDSRAAKSHGFLQKDSIDEATLMAIQALNAIAEQRGQSLAQMALAWNLRHPQVCSVVIGASRVSQVEDNLQALKNLEWSQEELQAIDDICHKRQQTQS